MAQDVRNTAARKKIIIVLVSGLVILLALAGLLLWKLVFSAPQRSDDFFDVAAQFGNLPNKTEEEIQEELNRVVEEGMFNIAMNTYILFPAPDSEGKADIENITANHYDMKVSIYLDEGNELVFESGGIQPGQYLETISLDKSLEAGTYPATAVFSAYSREEEDDHARVGQAAVKITLEIASAAAD